MTDRRLIETLPLEGRSPADPQLLRAARDALCSEALALGLTLILSDDWTELERVNATNREGWFPLLPKPASAPSFWVAAVDAEGEIVGTHGVVLLDCGPISFGTRVTNLSAFHGDFGPDSPAVPAGEWAFCASSDALETVGTVAWIVAGWNRPDWRGRGLFHLLGAVARLVVLARWSPRWVVGLVDPETTPVWRRRCAGRALLEPLPAILYHQEGVGRLPLHFMRWSRPAVVLDLMNHHGSLGSRIHPTALFSTSSHSF